MNIEETLQISSRKLEDTLSVGEKIGRNLKGNEVIELIGDVGSGKTVFVRGLAKGAGSNDAVASPSFTISRVYNCEKFAIFHFDFYRLSDPGIIKSDIEESANEDGSVVVVEWSDIVDDVLPKERLAISFSSDGESSREITLQAPEKLHYLYEGVRP